MPTLLFRDVGLVKGVKFDSWRRVGSAMQAIKVYNLREVDELVFLDITATREERAPDFQTIDELADECFMPLTVGGGIRSVQHIKSLLRVGADKVAINTEAVERPQIIREGADNFGSQCIVVSLDVHKRQDGSYELLTHSGTRDTDLDPVQFAAEAQQLGAGELLVTSVDRDGTMEGYDLDILRKISEVVDIPVIASGGAGNYEHMHLALSEGKASAVAAASIFTFTHQTPMEAKHYLRQQGWNVRI